MIEKIGIDVLVILIAGNSTGVLALAFQTYRMVKSHDRTLYGDDRNERHNGLVESVNMNESRAQENAELIDDNADRIREHRKALESDEIL